MPNEKNFAAGVLVFLVDLHQSFLIIQFSQHPPYVIMTYASGSLVTDAHNTREWKIAFAVGWSKSYAKVTDLIMKLHRYIDHDSQMTPIDFQVTRQLFTFDTYSFLAYGESIWNFSDQTGYV
ncbi:hypothetical protein DPMN_069669 [Dreissena polymorpha]|uniref:Uncharacterized protein n=1 Tax=Dreissena polymorpha TaxID=45954 RepID=A0A9D3Z1X3_DREPO|nr:hypothetical protein DPMN_069669 [Dreissena polymorpha]